MQKNLGALALLGHLTMLSLTGCGGGGSSSSPPPPPPPTAYTVGGNVSGLTASESVTLLNNGGDALTVTGNGSFTFSTAVNPGTGYAVTLQWHTPGITCSIGGASGSASSSNVTDVTVSCAPGAEVLLHVFGCCSTDGALPNGYLIMDSAGNFYGTTSAGGVGNDNGSVFKVNAAGEESVLYSFSAGATDGQVPLGGLAMDGAGNLYGSTNIGGANNTGTVFKISPSGAESILYSFGDLPTNDGDGPYSSLIIDSAGNLYGTTQLGGATNNGTVFKISPEGAETILHSFTGIDPNGPPYDGANPQSGVIMDNAGNLYGATWQGGANDTGTVYRISPSGTEVVLYSFGPVGTDGLNPNGDLIMDSAGNLYGTTACGGAYLQGTVFKLTPLNVESILFSFGGPGGSGCLPLNLAPYGANPNGKLIMDSAGNFYGTAYNGGATGGGTVFKLSPTGTIAVLYSFDNSAGSTDGDNPLGGLVMDSAGNLYGTTDLGGANHNGTVFKIN
jgi:uncharacterized repeat protein (TIGR03803 family)